MFYFGHFLSSFFGASVRGATWFLVNHPFSVISLLMGRRVWGWCDSVLGDGMNARLLRLLPFGSTASRSFIGFSLHLSWHKVQAA